MSAHLRCILFAILLSPLLFAEPVIITKIDGSRLVGELVSKSAEEIVLRTEDGIMRIAISRLTADTKAKLDLGRPADAEQLRSRVAELEQLVATLKSENQKLRQQLVEAKSAKPSGENIVEVAPKGLAPQREKAAGTHWLSKTGKRHNSRCRFYQTSAGGPCGSADGTACKICGG